jgi:hypothetical protein
MTNESCEKIELPLISSSGIFLCEGQNHHYDWVS